MLAVIVLYALLASTFVFAKKVIVYANPCFIIGFRMIFAGLILLGYLLITNRRNLIISRQHFWLFFKATIFHIYIAFIFEYWALQYLTALKVTIIYSATPFI